MKYKNMAIPFCIAAFCLGVAGCGSGGTDYIVFPNNLTLSEEYVEMEPDETATVGILDGNGRYSATSTNPEVVIATVINNSVEIRGIASGTARIVISDQEGVYGLISVLIFGDIVLEADAITVNAGDREMVLPATPGVLTIVNGNGGYTMTSDGNADFTVNGNEIEVMAYQMGEFTATVHDRTGRSADFTIIGMDPYVAFKNSTANAYTYSNPGSFWNNTRQSATIEGNYFIFRKYYEVDYGEVVAIIDALLRIPISETLSVGKKEGCKFHFENYWGTANNIGTLESPVDTDVWVLKNEGERVWIIYSSEEYDFNGTVCWTELVP